MWLYLDETPLGLVCRNAPVKLILKLLLRVCIVFEGRAGCRPLCVHGSVSNVI